MDWIDQPRAVREGEALDTAALQGYFAEHLPDFGGSVSVQQFPSGYSNLTYMLKVGDREVVLRRPPFGVQVKSGHDMGREYRILSHLIDVYPKVPRPLLYCDDERVIGAPFYVMERLQGIILRSSKPKGMDLTPAMMQQLSENFVDTLVELHRLDFQTAGLGDLGKPQGYVERQVEGWTRRYRSAQTDDIAAMDRIVEWLIAHMPPQSGAALIHNDYKYDNLVLDPGNPGHIIGVLDWEMATLGDPLMDIGTSLGYWVDPDDPAELKMLAFGVTMLPGNLTRSALLDRYAARSGCEVAHSLFYYVFGLFKIAVIVQQIYYRYKQGYTQDPRFAALILGVHTLANQAVLAVDKGRIDRLMV
jgi:aminoglycoside phosphotransferase (APT) family kinase protein